MEAAGIEPASEAFRPQVLHGYPVFENHQRHADQQAAPIILRLLSNCKF